MHFDRLVKEAEVSEETAKRGLVGAMNPMAK